MQVALRNDTPWYLPSLQKGPSPRGIFLKLIDNYLLNVHVELTCSVQNIDKNLKIILFR